MEEAEKGMYNQSREIRPLSKREVAAVCKAIEAIRAHSLGRAISREPDFSSEELKDLEAAHRIFSALRRERSYALAPRRSCDGDEIR